MHHLIRSVIKFISLIILFLLSGCSLFYGQPNDLPQTIDAGEYVITHVNVVNVKSGTVTENQFVHIKNEEIIAIGDNHPKEWNIPVKNANGTWMTPGLVDMHVHLYDRKDLVANLVYGVTTVRNLMGFPMHLRWREELKQKNWLGATPVVSSPILNGEENSHLLQTVVTTPETAQLKVRQYKEEGYDLLKFYGYLKPDVYDAMMTTAIELDMPVAKHGPYAPGTNPYRWMDKVQSFEHVEDIFQGPLNHEFDEAKLVQYIEDIKPIKPYITPTLMVYDHLTQLSQYKHEFVDGLPMKQHNGFFKWMKGTYRVNRWLNADEHTIEWNQKVMAWLMKTTKALYDANIPLLVGSDAGAMFTIAGDSTHREMQLMWAAGIPANEVLKSATWHPAVAMKRQDKYGTVETGKIADLVLVANNPLEDITVMQDPVAVIKEGQNLDRNKLGEMYETLDSPSGFMTGVVHLIEYMNAK